MGEDLTKVQGLSDTAIATLGRVKPEKATSPVVFGCNNPKPARFLIRLNSAIRPSVSTFGDINNQIAAKREGWRVISQLNPAKLGGGERLTAVAVPIGGIYVIRFIPIAEATPENASLFGWTLDPKGTILSKLINSCPQLKPAIVKKRDTVTGGMIQRPCKKTRVPFAEKEGWRQSSPEFIGSNSII